MKNKELYLHGHLGLGDMISINAIVRHFAKRYEDLYLFVKDHNLENARYMFRDLDNVKFIHGVGGEDEFVQFYLWTHPGINYLKLGHENLNRFPELNFDQVFYRVAGIPFEAKFENFYVKRDEKIENEVCSILNPTGSPYAFVHQDTVRGYAMNLDYIKDKGLKIIESNFRFEGQKDYLVFHYMKLIEEAREVHVMESAFKCMIDGYIKQKDNMFFHKYMRDGVSAVGRTYWNVINKR